MQNDLQVKRTSLPWDAWAIDGEELRLSAKSSLLADIHMRVISGCESREIFEIRLKIHREWDDWRKYSVTGAGIRTSSGDYVKT
jgi:hypothetical protein